MRTRNEASLILRGRQKRLESLTASRVLRHQARRSRGAANHPRPAESLAREARCPVQPLPASLYLALRSAVQRPWGRGEGKEGGLRFGNQPVKQNRKVRERKSLRSAGRFSYNEHLINLTLLERRPQISGQPLQHST